MQTGDEVSLNLSDSQLGDEDACNSSVMSGSVDLDSSALFDEDVKEQGLFLSEAFSAALKKAQTHLIKVKRESLLEKKKELQVRDVFYIEQVQKQQGIVAQLSENLALCKLQNERYLSRFDIIAEHLAVFCRSKKLLFASKQSALRAFGVLRENMAEARRNKMIFKLSDSKRRKALLGQCFLMWARGHLQSKTESSKAVLDMQHDTVVKDLIRKYEMRLGKLQADLDEAHVVIRKEQMRRQQLEEDLRRTFLKNMTNLNMEALSIFQTSYHDSVGMEGDVEEEISSSNGGAPVGATAPPGRREEKSQPQPQIISARVVDSRSGLRGEKPRAAPKPFPVPSK
jgi:hypothetical protein